MKREKIIPLVLSMFLLAGCSGNMGTSGGTFSNTDQTAAEATGAEAPAAGLEESGSDVSSEDETSKGVSSAPLSAEECEAAIDQLLESDPVKADDADTISEIARFVTLSNTLEGQGFVFAEMDNDKKGSLYYATLKEAALEGSNVGKSITASPDDTGSYSVVSSEDAAGLLKDLYGENNFSPTDYKPFSNNDKDDGNVYIEISDGEPVATVERSQLFENDEYILFTGPAFFGHQYYQGRFYGYADILFKKNPDSKFGVTALYGRYRDNSIIVSSVDTTSELPASKGKTYSGSNLVDSNYTTAWCEGVKGTGKGEKITLHLNKSQIVYGVQLCNGYNADAKLYSENGKVKNFGADFGNGAYKACVFDPPADSDYDPEELAQSNLYNIVLDEPVVTDTITIEINDAVAGSKYDDTCISEILVF